MRKFLLVGSFWFTLNLLFAQNQSDVTYWLDKADKVAFSNLDSALVFNDKALNIAQLINNQLLVFKVYRNRAFVLEDNNRFQDAVLAYQNAKNIAENSLDIKSKLAIYNDWAIINKKIKEFKVTQEYHLKAIALATQIEDWENVEAGYHGLGTMYSMLSNFSQAVYEYRKSIEIAEKSGNKKGILLSLQNISNVYVKAKDYENAKKNLQETYNLAIELKDSLRLATALKLYGTIEAEQKNYSQALDYYQKAKQIYSKKQKKDRLGETELSIAELWLNQNEFEKAKQSFELCSTYKSFFQPYIAADYFNKFAKLLIKTKQNQAAINVLQEGLTHADSIQFKEIAFDNLILLSNLYKEKGNYKEAIAYLSRAYSIQKSLDIDNSLIKFKQLEMTHDLELQAKEIEKQQESLRQSSILHWFLGSASIFLAILLYFTWRQLKEKKKAVAYSQLLLKELHHRVKNNLQNIVSIIRLQSRSVLDPEAKSVIKDSQERLEAIAILHQQFYQNEDINQVNFKTFLENLMQNKVFRENVNGKEIDYQIEVENQSITINNSLPIALIINELITNSIKHAFNNSTIQEPKISIVIKDKKLSYGDNGINENSALITQSKKNFGSQLIADLSHQLDAAYVIKSNPEGFRFELKF